MPTQTASNRDSFTMRARAAALRVADPNLSAEDASILAQRQYTETENAAHANDPGVITGRGPADATAARAALVPGLYPSTVPARTTAPGAVVPGLYQHASFERSADRILRQRFGPPPNERANYSNPSNTAVADAFAIPGAAIPQPTVTSVGQLDVADNNGVRSVPAPGLYQQPIAPGAAVAPAPSLETSTLNLPSASVPALPAYEPGSVAALMQGTGHDPTTNHAVGLYNLAEIDQRIRSEQELATQHKAAAERDATDATVLRDAVAPGRVVSAEAAALAYLRGGGSPHEGSLSLLKLLPSDKPSTGPLSYQEDPLTGRRFAVGDKGNFAASGVNPAKDASKKDSGVQTVQIGPRRYFYHGDSKRYFDEQGQPVVFPGSGAYTSDEEIAALARVGGGDVPPAAATAAGTKDSFVSGKVYTDKSGNRAKYLGGGKWQNL